LAQPLQHQPQPESPETEFLGAQAPTRRHVAWRINGAVFMRAFVIQEILK